MKHLFLLVCAVVVLSGHVLVAQTAPGVARATADTADGALVCAATRYRGRPLSIEAEDSGFEIRWLTPAQNVLRIQLAAPGCRFLEVRGVGQSEALIRP